jgi:hypothetical protein
MADFNAWYKQQLANEQKGRDETTSFLPMFNSGSSSSATSSTLFGSLPKFSLQDSSPPVLYGLSYAARFRLFISCLLCSALFFALGFLVGLPSLAVRPQKFALCFTIGSLLFMASFSMLKGPSAHFASMLTASRLPFTAVYVSSMGLTIYLTFSVGGVRGYVLVLGSTVVQLLSLLWYLITFLPGGTAGMYVALNAAKTMVRAGVGAGIVCAKACFRSIMG